MRKLPLLLTTALILAPSLSMKAEAQSGRDVMNRLSRLENEVQTLSRALYKGEAPPPSAVTGSGAAVDSANVEIRLQQLEGEIRTLTGRVEEDSYKIRQLESLVEKLSTDLNMRIGDLESGRGGAASGGGFANVSPAVPAPSSSAPYTAGGGVSSPVDTTSSAPATAVPGGGGYQYSSNNLDSTAAVNDGAVQDSGTPYVASQLGTVPQNASGSTADAAASTYENAFSLLKNGNYDASAQEFDTFLAQYPDHVLASNAQYWLGETYYVRGDYEKAARVFAEGYQKYPQGSKAADNLLKLGLALAATGNTGDACVALRQLQQDYSTGSGPVLRRGEQEAAKLGC